ncbi:hypothetical protein ACVBEG_27815 [Pseudomonas sp. GG8]
MTITYNAMEHCCIDHAQFITWEHRLVQGEDHGADGRFHGQHRGA